MPSTTPLSTFPSALLGLSRAAGSRLLSLVTGLLRWALSSAAQPLPPAEPREPLPKKGHAAKPRAPVSFLQRKPKQMGPSVLADHSPAAAIYAVLRECVIADLETTGLSAAADDIIEVGAWRLSAKGEVLSRLSMLVRPRGTIPSSVSKLTGITDQMVRTQGVELSDALQRLHDFAGDTPVLFHNAGFDARFLVAAAAQTGQQLPLLHTRDTLGLARRVWPELPSHRLSVVAEHLKGPVPTHRVSSDLAAMQVLVTQAAARLNEARLRRLQAAPLPA